MSNRTRFSIPSLVAMVMLAGLFQSCKHDPVSPPPPPPPPPTDTTKHPDTTQRILQIMYDSASSVIRSNMLLNVTAKPVNFPKIHTIAWTIDTTHISRARVDTISFFFRDSGAHTVTAVYIDSTGSRRDSTATTIYIKDTTHKPINPNDTTSHDFAWSQHTNVNGENNMTGCWVFGPNDIYAVNGDLHHFDGTSWTRIIIHDDSGNSWESRLSGATIYGFSGNDMWFVYYSFVLHYLGNGLVHYYPLFGFNHGRSYNCWGQSSDDLYVVGDSGLIAHFDGTNWTKMVSGTTQGLSRVWGTSDHDIWAAGFDGNNGQSALQHYDGSQWTTSNVNVLGEVDAVWTCDSTTSHHVAFACGGSVWRETDNGTWSLSSNSLPNDHVGLEQVTGNTANDVFCDGSFGMLLHWNGRSWYRYDQFYAPSGSRVLGAMSCKDNTICAVGFKDGSSWVLVGQRK